MERPLYKWETKSFIRAWLLRNSPITVEALLFVSDDELIKLYRIYMEHKL